MSACAFCGGYSPGEPVSISMHELTLVCCHHCLTEGVTGHVIHRRLRADLEASREREVERRAAIVGEAFERRASE